MDHLIQTGLSNLEIETQHPHSSSSSPKEDEVKRNWLELPSDVLSLIFMKMGHVDILASAQWVCIAWWKLSKQPHLFCSIHVEEVVTSFRHSVPLYTIYEDRLAREAIDRSCGQLVEFSVRDGADDELLQYLSDKSGSLRCIRLVSCYGVGGAGLIELAKKLPQLEDFEIIDFPYITKDVIEAYGRLCPRLKSCRLNYVNYKSTSGFHSVVVAIAQNMPELRSLHLFGSRFTDDGLKAVLDGCSHLESLDLRQCFDLQFAGDLEKRCGDIKVLRLPNDPTDDFEYNIQCYPTHDFYYFEDDSHEYYGSKDNHSYYSTENYDSNDIDYVYDYDYDYDYDYNED